MNQTLEKIFAKAGGMRDGQPNILVEVKHFNLLPVDISRTGERIEKICDAPRMEVKFPADLGACESPLTECGEEIERDRCQQDLGIPEAERSLQNCVRRWRSCFHTVVSNAILQHAGRVARQRNFFFS